MKQKLTEPCKDGIADDEQLILRSKLAKNEKLVEELRKENEVRNCLEQCMHITSFSHRGHLVFSMCYYPYKAAQSKLSVSV